MRPLRLEIALYRLQLVEGLHRRRLRMGNSLLARELLSSVHLRIV
jgi:hypothetical protein